ncbi:MAG: hypothetical protein QME25_02725 [Bacteroidota bacterium]|nr:hypothetical protein [Bacteroidota bacterium]
MKSDNTFLKHILDEINFLLKETESQSYDQFIHDELTKRAYSRSLEIIGGVNYDILWDTIKNKLPGLKTSIGIILKMQKD